MSEKTDLNEYLSHEFGLNDADESAVSDNDPFELVYLGTIKQEVKKLAFSSLKSHWKVILLFHQITISIPRLEWHLKTYAFKCWEQNGSLSKHQLI